MPNRDTAQHQSTVTRTLNGSVVARRPRIDDLRHTAACLWLARSVDPSTVQAWLGHASIATTNLYLHHLGTPADRAGLDRLNARRYTGGYTNRGREPKTTTKPRPILPVAAGRTGSPSVELRGFEPLAFSLRTRRATNCATAPRCGRNDNTSAQAGRNRIGDAAQP